MKTKSNLSTSNAENRDWEAIKKQMLEDVKSGAAKVYAGSEKWERIRRKKQPFT